MRRREENRLKHADKNLFERIVACMGAFFLTPKIYPNFGKRVKGVITKNLNFFKKLDNVMLPGCVINDV
jgi:hypothetical protein